MLWAGTTTLQDWVKCWFAKKVPRLCGDALLGYKRDLGAVKGKTNAGGAGGSCVDSKAVGLHGLVLTDKASLNGQPLRRRSTTLSFKTCAGIATSAACALVLMFRAVSETRHAVWLLFADWLLAAGGGASLSAFGAALVQACVAVTLSQWRRFVVNAEVMISHEELYARAMWRPCMCWSWAESAQRGAERAAGKGEEIRALCWGD